MKQKIQLTRQDYASKEEVRWCPGCGDYAVLAAVQKVLAEVEEKPEDVVFVSGIGCSSRFPYYLNTYGFHTIHGRAPTIATGLKMVRPELKVWVVTGDGDGLSIGAHHLLHLMRRNVNVKVLLLNNRIYGLTKGQSSPTSVVGQTTKSMPWGTMETAFSPMTLALAAHCSFVARSIDIDTPHLTSVLQAAAKFEGSAFIEIFQNCPVFNEGAFAAFAERPVRGANTLVIGPDAAPLTFNDGTQGLRWNGASFEIVGAGQASVFDPKCDRAMAYALSELNFPGFPVPVGVFNHVERPTYEGQWEQLHREEAGKKGNPSLSELLAGNRTWRRTT